MQYQMQYNVCAIIICVIVLSTHLLRKKTKEYHNTIFTLILITTLFGAVFNIANTVGNMKIVAMDQTLLEVLDYLHFLILNIPPFLFAVYAVTLVRNDIFKVSRLVRAALFVPEMFALLTVLSNYWTRWYFYYENGVYQRGTCQAILFVVDLYFVAFGVIYILLAKEETSRSTKYSVCAYMIIGYVTAAIQLLNPPLLLMHFGMAICALALFLNLQKEEYLNSELGVFNRRIMEKIIKNNLSVNKKMSVLLFKIEDLNFIVHNFGAENRKTLLLQIARFLDRISKGNVYYYNSGTFVIMTADEYGRRIESCVRAIQDRFHMQWKIGNAKFFVNYKMMSFSMPEDVRDLNTFYCCNSEFSSMIPDKDHIIDIHDIDFNQIDRKIRIEKIIKRAIEEDHFQVYYQPIYSMEKDRITSAEALLRLIDPDDGFIRPDEFIPIAEKNGTIIQIGEIVFEKVLRFMQEQKLEEMGIEYIEINLSAVQCMQEELADTFLALIQRYGIRKNMVNLEITETAAIDSPKVVLKNMQKLSDEGITFSMDDFGPGYSNISMIMSLPLNIIKLDKSLIDMASGHPKGKEILLSTAAMVKKLGFKIVAEGVEEQEQVEALRPIGIDYIQGYYFSRPLPEGKFVEYLNRSNGRAATGM